MTTEEKQALVYRLIEAHNRQDALAAMACFAPDATNHGRPVGREVMLRIFHSLYQAFPDYHFEVELLLVEDAWVTTEVLMTGTHQGTPDMPVLGGLLTGVPPTGKPVAVQNVHLYRMAGGLIAEHRAVRDDLGMMQQLGLLPTPTHAAGDISRRAL